MALSMQTIHLYAKQNVQRVTFSSIDIYIQYDSLLCQVETDKRAI